MTINGTDLQIAFCGSAGDGTIAVGDILKQAMAMAGYRVIAFDQYPAEIRGFGKCVSRTRVTGEQVYSMKQQTDILVSLDDSHAIPHASEVRDFGAVIYDNAPMSLMAEGEHISGHLQPGQIPYALPIREISERATGSNRGRNMVALGFVAGLYGLQQDVFHTIIARKFKTKPAAVTTDNTAAFDAGFDLGAGEFLFDEISIGEPPAKAKHEARMLSGNSAVVEGCLDAGIEAYFGYPITPATTIMERLVSEMPKRGKRALQTEDEISAIAATIGAGYAGVRSATATSGPGLALMAEMLGLSVMAEVPAVIFVSQRGGPSTGMPTKTEQSDLNLAVFGGSGDAQRIVLAPTNVEGCWRCAGKAFEMAERYQTPVIVLLDLYLSNRYETVVVSPDEQFEPNMSKPMVKGKADEKYQRFATTDDGISPRAIPGQLGGIHTVTGLEHNDMGRPSDQPNIHMDMSEKRHNKLAKAIDHPGITITKRFGDEGDVDVGILAWGSTFGESLEAMMLAREEGIKCAAMKVVMMSPLPEQPITDFMDSASEVLIPELNYEGQFAGIVSGTLGRPVNRLNMVPGTPMRVDDILAEIRKLAGRDKRDAA
ncbi:MAG: 2-oxoacid:acceptor oxidoreductase subunit alpha [Alphaproteobacteria bacterium]|nr:2-oxoacid:acceptor oxidoreductase subunit alpha [Alphaproteobacteria bacterium]MBT4083345.1 2-oxoacid:acceptor oxidoreductase subunit alpha [Alphaproteobacteria bacterium]MBT4543003.1 2-oxoacid:acceptor oxidoreductase subunit alpha [Alphaproteobacteria bacterium]MBT6387990.1 2-oxoacid:acceptor oxidoreductase subunit alpha [Alphaproteobacteria bacterium]MBT7746504.1 2-oxoacid:acceptor oxidoreductase subunit alpha [Alphaproteobacteria bacterium]